MRSIYYALVFVATFLVQNNLIAQTYSFKVLVNKGRNEIRSGSSWQQVKVGTSLTETDEIKIVSNAYMGLVHVTGKPLELKEAKTYKVSDLAKRISSGSNVLTKYTDFILSSNTTASSRIGATGASDRSPDKMFFVFLPSKSELSVFYNAKQIISWDKNIYHGPYIVTFTTLFEDELKKIETADNKVEVDLDAPEFQNEDNILVKVVSKDGNKVSQNFALKRLSNQDRARIENSLKEISTSVEEETSLTKYILSGFYEQNNLYIDAATCYQEAIRLAPDPAIYLQNYEDFLLRTGLKTPPAKGK